MIWSDANSSQDVMLKTDTFSPLSMSYKSDVAGLYRSRHPRPFDKSLLHIFLLDISQQIIMPMSRLHHIVLIRAQPIDGRPFKYRRG